MQTLNRRTVLGLLGLGSIAATLPGCAHHHLRPDGAGNTTNSTSVFPTLNVGDFRVTCLSDGTMHAPAQPMFASKVKRSLVEHELNRFHLSYNQISMALNTLVLQRGSELILVDSGGGGNLGASAGLAHQRLRLAGFHPSDVTAVVLTHAHPDHIGGLVDATGERAAYPNAKVFISKEEHAFWMKKDPDMRQVELPEKDKAGMAATIRRQLGVVLKQTEVINTGDTVTDGVVLQEAFGHTPGHSLVSISSKGQKIVHIGDAANHFALQLSHPDWTICFDVDRKQVVSTRKRVCAEMAREGTLLVAYHFPYPGIGRIEHAGKDSYRWAPAVVEV